MIPLSFYSIPVLMGCAMLAAATYKKQDLSPIIAIGGSFITAVLSILTLLQVATAGPASTQVSGWPAPYGISIVVDQLSVIFISLVSVIGFFAVIFSRSYIKEHKPEYFSLVCLLLAGILGALHTADVFNMFVFFELMSISSYALVAFNRSRKAFEASIKYLIMGALATSLMLLGIVLLYGSFGTVNMADLAMKASGYTGNLLPVAIGLLLTGFAIKAGLVPFHTWLPDAHPAAPSPISAVLSGLEIKVGIYCIIRIGFTIFGAPQTILSSLVVLGLLSMVIGGVLAFMQTDIKRLLAYSSISQMGYITLAFGLGTQLGVSGALFHVINHAIIKSLLFFITGVLFMQTKTSDMYKMAGTIRSGPLLTYSFLIGILALGGVPFLNGFSSKWMIYIATFQVNPLLTIFTLIITALTLAYGLKAFYMIFMSNPNPGVKTLSIPMTMSFVIVTLTVACLVLGLFPDVGYRIADFALPGFDANNYIRTVLG